MEDSVAKNNLIAMSKLANQVNFFLKKLCFLLINNKIK